MTGAGIALDCRNMIDHLRGMGFAVSFMAASAVFFVHPGNHAQGTPRMEMKPLQKFGGGHRDYDTGTVINGAAAEIPRIKMARDDDDLFGMLASLEVGDDVVANGVRQVLRSECKVHANTPLRSEMLDQVGIFGRKSGGRNRRGKTEAGVRK